MSERRFSVVIPTLNEGELLAMTTHSILSRTRYPDFEIIVDSQGHPHRVATEMPDAWRARVMATYVPEPVFGNATSVSASVNGSWGALGDD